MEIEQENKFPGLMSVNFSPRRSGNETVSKCLEATCTACMQDSNYRYYCTSQAIPRTRTRKVGFEPTPNHPDGLKWHPVYEFIPVRKRLSELDACPEGKWVDEP